MTHQPRHHRSSVLAVVALLVSVITGTTPDVSGAALRSDREALPKASATLGTGGAHVYGWGFSDPIAVTSASLCDAQHGASPRPPVALRSSDLGQVPPGSGIAHSLKRSAWLHL